MAEQEAGIPVTLSLLALLWSVNIDIARMPLVVKIGMGVATLNSHKATLVWMGVSVVLVFLWHFKPPEERGLQIIMVIGSRFWVSIINGCDHVVLLRAAMCIITVVLLVAIYALDHVAVIVFGLAFYLTLRTMRLDPKKITPHSLWRSRTQRVYVPNRGVGGGVTG